MTIQQGRTYQILVITPDETKNYIPFPSTIDLFTYRGSQREWLVETGAWAALEQQFGDPLTWRIGGIYAL